jgi:hypothetical protein
VLLPERVPGGLRGLSGLWPEAGFGGLVNGLQPDEWHLSNMYLMFMHLDFRWFTRGGRIQATAVA